MENKDGLGVGFAIRVEVFYPPRTQQVGQLWLRGGASILLSEGPWFDSPVEMSLGKILNSDVLVCTLHGSHPHQCMNPCMNYCKSLWTKASAKCP